MNFLKTICALSIFTSVAVVAQPVNDLCNAAVTLCEGESYTGSTIGATASASDYNACYTPTSSIWYQFSTNDLGGSVTVSFSNLIFNPDPSLGQTLQAFFFKTSGDCDDTPYTIFSNCGEAGVPFDLNELIVLAPNTTYFIQVNGATPMGLSPAECTFDISISGGAVFNPEPSVTISAEKTTICQNEQEEISIDIINCSDTVVYEWFYNGTSIFTSPENTFNTSFLEGDGDLELEVTCGEDCPKTARSNAISFVVTPVSAEAGDDLFIEPNEQVTLNGDGIGSPIWSPGSSLTNTNIPNPIANPENTTTYYLTFENDGCFASDSVTVFVGEIIRIFSVFTPNGDNINDRWRIINSDKFPNMSVDIYDRSGQKVFSAVNYTQEDQWWDGTFKNKPLPTSTYYYVINLNEGENAIYKGQVTIIR
jgi:gliding motility-associated-like protein